MLPEILEEENKQITCTPYRISTITVTGSINIDVSLDNLYNVLSTHTPKEISYLEFGKNKYDLQTSGQKTTKTKNKVEKKKRFDNQLTIVMFLNQNKYNMKLFKNGNIQITGVKGIDKGKEAIDFLITVIKTIKQTDESLICDVNQIQNINYRVRLINSDFKVNFQIRLDYLFRVITQKYKITCSYEPCIYPGAKIEYYFPNNGYCKCTTFCNGKSTTCKKITIAVFQSGCVIITGANQTEHIEVAYSFICNILKDDYQEIHRKKIILPIVV